VIARSADVCPGERLCAKRIRNKSRTVENVPTQIKPRNQGEGWELNCADQLAEAVPMPRFFFQTYNGEASSGRDPDGQDLSGIEAAEAEAYRAIGGILKDEIGEGRLDVEVDVHISDEQGMCVSHIHAEAHLARRPL
jgi:hypothetical protein